MKTLKIDLRKVENSKNWLKLRELEINEKGKIQYKKKKIIFFFASLLKTRLNGKTMGVSVH